MRKTIKITLALKELIYDVQNKTYLTARSRKGGDNDEQVANMMASDDEENANQVLRSIQNSIGVLKTKLSEYMAEDTTTDNDALDGANTTTVTTDKTIDITLNMPVNFNAAVVTAITAACHSYIVDMSVAEWFVITDKADAKEYADMATADLQNIREAVNKRCRPVY